MTAAEKIEELSGTVGEVMNKQVVAVLANVSAAETAEQMAAAGVRHAVVIDQTRRVLGVVSQRDVFAHFMETLREQVSHGAPDAPAEPAAGSGERAPWEIGSLIQKTPITVSPDALLCRAGIVLANYKIDCLPVVDEQSILLGTLSIKEVLHHIVGKLQTDIDDEFTFFTPEKKSRPQMPAFFRRANGSLVLPVTCLEDPANLPGFAVLGYHPAGSRIAVKFVSDKNVEGARKVQRDGDNLVIAASDFVARFDIKLHVSAFEITRHPSNTCVILTPRQQIPAVAPAAPVTA